MNIYMCDRSNSRISTSITYLRKGQRRSELNATDPDTELCIYKIILGNSTRNSIYKGIFEESR